MDYFYNKRDFFKDMRYFFVLVLLVTITNPIFVMEGKDIIYQNSFIFGLHVKRHFILSPSFNR